jgi:hypothetical protein
VCRNVKMRFLLVETWRAVAVRKCFNIARRMEMLTAGTIGFG